MHIDPTQEGPSDENFATLREFGVLVVPFPYQVDDREFRTKSIRGQKWTRLELRCTWGTNPRPLEMAQFIAELMRQARHQGRTTDILILPELALSESQLGAVWKMARRRGVRLLLAGINGRNRSKSPSVGLAKNFAMGVYRGKTAKQDSIWRQPKHHRWRIDASQIRNYGLPLMSSGDTLWEDIEVDSRSVVATRFAAGSTVACLICEDLARIEPVQPVLREMGPSLVVALLMDGPQVATRWSARSATVFSDDPGSSVLTVTSVGLVRRYQRHKERFLGNTSPSIALWQEPNKGPREIPLAPNSHAVHFQLAIHEQQETTLDGRNDRGTAEVLRLIDEGNEPFLQVGHPSPPKWALCLYEKG